jgi:hypothetical protein
MLCAARLQAKGDEVMLETWTGDHRLQQDEDMSGSSKITIIWCAKDMCGDDLVSLEDLLLLPNAERSALLRCTAVLLEQLPPSHELRKKRKRKDTVG